MKKNVAGQTVSAMLVNRSDGTPLTTGSVTCYVTGNNGAQAAGSVGSGACTHKGNGEWQYEPAQAETNYDRVSFVFVHTSGVNALVQIWTGYPQTGDAFAKWTAAMTEAYASDGAAPTPEQMLFMLWALASERSVSGTTLTAKKLDGATSAMTFTLNDATNPTSQTRST